MSLENSAFEHTRVLGHPSGHSVPNSLTGEVLALDFGPCNLIKSSVPGLDVR